MNRERRRRGRSIRKRGWYYDTSLEATTVSIDPGAVTSILHWRLGVRKVWAKNPRRAKDRRPLGWYYRTATTFDIMIGGES